MKKLVVISLITLYLILQTQTQEAVSDDISKDKKENTTEKTVVVPEKPEAYLIQPVARKSTPMLVGTEGPCSGVAKGPAHAIYSPGALTRVAWRINHSALDGNCSIYLYEGIGDYTPLKTDQPCGRDTGVEFIFVQFPANMTCDQCQLQWVWKTYQGNLFQCSDIMVLDMQSSCLGKCQNGGVCLDGWCMCTEGFTGSYCESELNAEEGGFDVIYFIIFMSMIIMIIILCCCIYWCTHIDKLSPQMQQSIYTCCPWLIGEQEEEQYGREEQQMGVPGHVSKYPDPPQFGEQGGNPFDAPALFP